MNDDETTHQKERRYERHPGPFNGWCIGSERREVRVVDLSLGGCLVLASSGTAVGETFRLHVDLGDEGLLDVSATTLYHTMNGSAVTFFRLTPTAFEMIQRTVGMRAPSIDERG
jgi:hypothetical protein